MGSGLGEVSVWLALVGAREVGSRDYEIGSPFIRRGCCISTLMSLLPPLAHKHLPLEWHVTLDPIPNLSFPSPSSGNLTQLRSSYPKTEILNLTPRM